MFRFNSNGTFQTKDISILFPENFGIDISSYDFGSSSFFGINDSPESSYWSESNLAAYDPKQQYCIEWQVRIGCDSSEKELQKILNHSFRKLSMIEPFIQNGLKGHQVLYTSDNEMQQYFERRYDLGKEKQLIVLISTTTDIKAILEKPEIKKLLANIKRI